MTNTSSVWEHATTTGCSINEGGTKVLLGLTDGSFETDTLGKNVAHGVFVGWTVDVCCGVDVALGELGACVAKVGAENGDAVTGWGCDDTDGAATDGASSNGARESTDADGDSEVTGTDGDSEGTGTEGFDDGR